MTNGNQLEQAPGVLFSELSDGRGVLLSVDGGVYYTLNHTGCDVWHALKSPATPEEIASLIADRYTLAKDQAVEDVSALLEDLLSRGLVLEQPT